ncbi:hypothetical protein [Flavivirga spongiicola]|uniref:Uncharacterized protein n=1 Tax=Flavivirga spongiicola TaxID=421621 RepID=A0ABU7XSL8_9FLAO|nr:hypothetical protein [Flavivirga sp. MEBiC05379]MDO5978585.1 hypothetical protein [Flavivirga sp. MEBiC05379]
MSFSQTESFLIQVGQQSNKTYTYKIEETSTTNTFKNVDKEMKKMLDSIGFPIRLKANKKESFRMKVFTFNVDNNKDIPVEILFDQFSYKGKYNRDKIDDRHDFNSLKIIGRINTKKEIIIGDFFIDNKRSKDESIIKPYYNNFGSIVIFPDDSLLIGDSFIVEKPMINEESLADIIGSTIKSKLTLTQVKKGTAYFSIEQIVKLDKENAIKEITNLNVKSKGELEVDIDGNYIKRVFLESYVNYDKILHEGNTINFKHKSTLRVNIIEK